MKKLSFLLIMSSILLAGCGEEAKTKEYFEAHPDEAKAKYNECFNTQSGKGRMSSDKIFATECANVEIAIKGIWEKEREEKEAPEALPILVGDLGAYYVSQAKFSDKLSTMTTVKIMNENGLSGSIGIQGKPCVNVSIITKDKKPFLKIEKVSNPDQICSKIFNNQKTKELIDKKGILLSDYQF